MAVAYISFIQEETAPTRTKLHPFLTDEIILEDFLRPGDNMGKEYLQLCDELLARAR